MPLPPSVRGQSRAGERAGVALMVAGTVAVGIAYGATMLAPQAASWPPWLLAFGASLASVSLFVLGAASRGAFTRAVAILLAALFVVLAGSFGAALALTPNEGRGALLLFGLPLRLAVVFYGVGFVPLLVLPIAFTMTFRGRDA